MNEQAPANYSDTTVLVLAGGLGTRLRPLTHTVPKVLVPVLGRPFLEHVLADLALQGVGRFVLSVGFLAEQVVQHFGDGSAWGYQLSYAREAEPLGTGGALVHALDQLSDPFVVVNGDTLLQLDLAALLQTHQQLGEPLTLAAAEVPDRGRYGALEIRDQRVQRFEEKRQGLGPGPINGGVYAVSHRLLLGAPAGAFSLERDWLPRFAGRIAVLPTRGYFVDMGTHEVLRTLDQSLAAYLERRDPGEPA